MNINKFISYLLCNKGIIVNLYKLYFPSFLFSLLPNKRVFHSLIFSPFQPNTQEGKVNIFYRSTFPSSYNFSSSHFSIPLTKQNLRVWDFMLFLNNGYGLVKFWIVPTFKIWLSFSGFENYYFIWFLNGLMGY